MDVQYDIQYSISDMVYNNCMKAMNDNIRNMDTLYQTKTYN